MRSLLALIVLALTCAPAAAPDVVSEAQPLETAPLHLEFAPALLDAPDALQTTRLVVQLPRDTDEPWTTRARDAWEISSDDLMGLLVPPEDVWPEDDLGIAFRHALCADVDSCDDVDDETAWEEVAEELEAAGLSTDAPGTEGNAWERYATLWLRYVQSSGFFLTPEDRVAIEAGLQATLEETDDEVLRGPLVLATILMGPDDEAFVRDLTWELVEEHDDALALVGMEALLEVGESPEAFDDLDLDPDGPLELLRRRLAVESAVAAGTDPTEATAKLMAHPQATSADAADARELEVRRRSEPPAAPWAAALVADAASCADLEQAGMAELEVRNGEWTSQGDGSLADCLYGWSWPDAVPDQRVELHVVR